MKTDTKKICIMGILSALAVVSVMYIRFPIFPAATFLEYDFADVFIFICGFLYGPIEGLILTLVVSILQGLTVSSGSGIYGVIMHVWVTGVSVAVSASFYKRFRHLKGAIISLVLGFVAWMIASIIGNLIITPMYTGMDVKAVAGMLIFPIIPFNLIKVCVNSLITFVVYKHLSRLFDKLFHTDHTANRSKGIAKAISLGYNESIEYLSKSSNATKDFAKRLAKGFVGGEIVILRGELGAGKTVFTKGIAMALGVKKEVVSPTFNLVKEYNDATIPMFHFDMYRLESGDELYETGAHEYLGRGVTVIEWNKFERLQGDIYEISIEKKSDTKRMIKARRVSELYENTVS